MFFPMEDYIVWFVLMLVLSLLALSAAVYLVARFHRFSFLTKLGQSHPLLSWLLALLPLALLGLFLLFNLTTLIVVLLHVTAGFLIFDLIAFLVRKAGKKTRYDLYGGAALLFTLIYLGIGWIMAHHVFETHYRLTTDKAIGEKLRIVEIADSHLGITLDGEGFAQQMRRIQTLEPDIVVLVGDFVDDDSKADDMLAACRALGELSRSCGVYFVYGNHDDGYFDYRNFSSAQLREALTENGVHILEDEAVTVGESLTLVGRRDRSMSGRLDMASLAEDLDPSKYTVLLDHQPNDYASEAASGVDLVLSGHTHGGHIFPAGQIGLLMRANDRVYGMEERNGTTFIVTSGISGWAIPFKTGTFSEFVVIDVVGADRMP